MKNEEEEMESEYFVTAVYIIETYGHEVPDEIIIDVAEALNLCPEVLLENYTSFIKIDNIFEKYLPRNKKLKRF